MNDETFTIPRWVWIGLAVLTLLALGVAVSPRDAASHPILLLPDAKAVEDYRDSAQNWHTRLKTLDAEIATILSGKFGNDLFAKSREAQRVTDAAIQLAQEIDRRNAPTAAIPAKSLLVKAASAYLDASRDMLQWVTAPKDENLAKARKSLNLARQALKELEQSEWISR